MNNVLVLGRGFLGKAFEQAGYTVVGRDHVNIIGPEIYGSTNTTPIVFAAAADYNNSLIFADEYDVIINCIAKSNTRWCEEPRNHGETLTVNGLFPAFLSEYCRRHNKKLVHISTGCLYDDMTEENDEGSFLAAHCNYTVSKWVGENFLSARDLILRPRLLFGDFEDRNNLLCKLSNFNSYVVEINSICSIHTIVKATGALIKADATGVFNICNNGNYRLSTIAEGMMGLPRKDHISGKELIEREGLYLVNNTMNCDKLRKFYEPDYTTDEVMRCWDKISEKNT